MSFGYFPRKTSHADCGFSKERIDTTYGDIAEFGGEGPETRRINVEGDGVEWVGNAKLITVAEVK